MKAELNKFPYVTLLTTASGTPVLPDTGSSRLFVRADGTFAFISSTGTVTDIARSSDVAAISTADRARANHTGTQPSTTISDFTPAVKTLLGSAIVAGTNVTKTIDPVSGNVTLSASGTGGGGGLSVSVSPTDSNALIISDTGTANATVTVNPADSNSLLITV